jgi:phospholipid/cholesterol/gamma-HCH transport system substrate-binding protein
MFKGNRNLAVGLFVSVALAGVAGFAMWLAGTKGNQPMKTYSLLFERDVSGLSLGGPVYYLGVNVGNVSDMALIPGEHVKVRVDIDVLADTPIDSGSYASLNAQGITGVTVINVRGEPGTHAPLQKTTGFRHPLIPVRQTGLSALLSSAPETIAKVNQVLDQVNVLLGEQNRQTIEQLLQNIAKISSAVAEEREAFADLPGEIQALLAESRSAVAEIQSVIESVQPDLTTAMSNVNNVTNNLSGLTGRVDQWLADNEAEFEYFIDNGLGQAPELIYDMRNALRELQKLLHQLQEDPSQLIHRSPDDALEVNP